MGKAIWKYLISKKGETSVKTYRIEYTAVLDIEAESEEEALEQVTDQFLLDSLSITDVEEL